MIITVANCLHFYLEFLSNAGKPNKFPQLTLGEYVPGIYILAANII
jgi:hypothetical protein